MSSEDVVEDGVSPVGDSVMLNPDEINAVFAGEMRLNSTDMVCIFFFFFQVGLQVGGDLFF